MNAVLKRAATKQTIAEEILADLDLVSKWSAFGEPYIVGATAMGLLVAPDIDMEIYCDSLRIEDGFSILQKCAHNPNVAGTEFKNCLYTPDQGYYWKLNYRDEEGELWKIDMWSVKKKHSGPLGKDFVEPMRKALTPDLREKILKIKEGTLIDPSIQCRSVFIYQAVLEGQVTDIEGLREWLKDRDIERLNEWTP